jgi:hypothetical protein
MQMTEVNLFKDIYQSIIFEIAERFKESYQKLAPQTPGTKTSDGESVLALVKTRLSSRESGPWLLVLDNADHVEIFAPGYNQPQSILSSIPHSEEGSILITSRDYNVASQIVSNDVCLTQILAMAEKECISLSRNIIARDQSPTSDSAALAKKLDYLVRQ